MNENHTSQIIYLVTFFHRLFQCRLLAPEIKSCTAPPGQSHPQKSRLPINENISSSPKIMALPFKTPCVADKTITKGDKRKNDIGNIKAEKTNIPLRTRCLIIVYSFFNNRPAIAMMAVTGSI